MGEGETARSSVRDRLRTIIFEADTPAGKAFDVGLLVVILLSVLAVMLESVQPIRERYASWLLGAEWGITGLFTVEYILRLASVDRPIRYARSFFGVVDLVAILPTYVSLLLPGAQSLLVIRAVRLLRVFRVFKLTHYLVEGDVLMKGLRASGPKVTLFLGTVMIVVVIMGAAMYLVEGEEGGFTSIPTSMYWAVVTMTTVGYGDITPTSALGKILAVTLMVMGYAIIAVPTGIVSAELVQAQSKLVTTRVCPSCFSEGHARTARFCLDCGGELAKS